MVEYAINNPTSSHAKALRDAGFNIHPDFPPLDPRDASYGGGLDWEHFDESAYPNLDPTFGGAFQEGLSYEEWQQILSRMQATPPLPARINPFRPAGPGYYPEGYPDGY
jgi:hypothetical protein